MSAIVIIPARFGSTRFPGKPLAPLRGIPLIQHVYENAVKAKLVEKTVVATDSQEIMETVKSFGGTAVMTGTEHPSGTDRIAEVARELRYDIIVNVQGDEPLLSPEMIDDVIVLLNDQRASIGTLQKTIVDQTEIFNPNVVKVVTDHEGFALYFSRAPIPYSREDWRSFREAAESVPPAHAQANDFRKHIGIYSYRKDVLLALAGLPVTRLEEVERLEQLRALENGYRIKTGETQNETFGVDTPEDLERIETWLNSSS